MVATLASEHAPALDERGTRRLLGSARLVDRLVVWTFGLTVASGTLLAAATLANAVVFDGRVETIDGRIEESVWTWAASSASLAGALACIVHAIAFTTARRRWAALGLVLAFFSLDDSLRLHETIGHRVRVSLGLPEYVGALWLLVYVPVLVFAVWALVVVARESDRSVRLALGVGLALLASGVALEAIGIPTKWLETAGVSWPHAARGILEEATELSGIVAIAGALVASLVAAIEAAARRGAPLTTER